MNSQTVTVTEAILAKVKDLFLEQPQQILDFVEFIAEKYLENQFNENKFSQKRVSGLQKGKIWISEDFNEPLEFKTIEE